jgi:hypothetical protein
MGELREQMRRGERQAPSPDDSMTRLVARRERRHRNGRLLSAAVALAMAGALVAGGFVVLGHRGSGAPTQVGNGTSGGSGPATSGAGSSSNLVAGPGQYYYWKYAVVMHGTTAHLTYWWSPDGTGQMVNSVSGDGYGVLPSGPLQMGKFPIGDDLSNLSTDPAKLLDQLKERSGPGGASPRPVVTPGAGQDEETGVLVSAIEDLMSEMAPHSSPLQRVAMYEVLKGIPSVQDLGAQNDPTGRPATALRVTLSGVQKTFWFDPDTHLFLAEEESDSGSPAPAATSGATSGATGGTGASASYVIVQSGGIVDSESAAPNAGQEIIPDAGALPTP